MKYSDIYKYKNGGEPKAKTNNGKIEGEPVNSEYNKLTESQKEILKKGNNLNIVKDWYSKYPEDMEGFNQWINTHNSEKLQKNYEEKEPKFQEALKNSREWNNEWYKQRATMPQFKDVATKRLNISNQLNTQLSDPINLSMEWWKSKDKPPEVFYAPEIGGINKDNKSFINSANIRRGDSDIITKSEPYFENQYFTDTKGRLQNSLITHEEGHQREHIAPQLGTKLNVNKFKWGEGNNLDPIEKIITKEEQINDPRNQGYPNSYLQQPTEVRSRLQVWRQMNNIDPLKKYSVEEIDKIIKSNLNNPNINDNIKELFDTLKNDPVKLKYLHDNYVSTNKNNQIQSAKNGGVVKYLKDNYYNKLK